MSTSYMHCFKELLSIPKPLVLLPCGSLSNSNTFLPISARQDAKFIHVVVFPTPPFWLATAITFPPLFTPFIFFFISIILTQSRKEVYKTAKVKKSMFHVKH